MTEADNRDTKKAPAATGAGAETDAGAAVSYPYSIQDPKTCQALEAIPLELRQAPQWAAWRAEWIPDKNRWDKAPRSPATGKISDAMNPANLGSFDAALDRAKQARLSGVGYVLAKGSGLVGIDLDHVRDPKSGHIQAEASAKVKRLASYTELSPSGTGLHIIIKGQLPPDGRKKGDFECYDIHFLTMTGYHLPGTPATIEARQDALEAIHAEIFGRPKPAPDPSPAKPTQWAASASDPDLIQRAMKARNGAKFTALWHGDWQPFYPSQSEADSGLCEILAFWTNGDAARIDQLFHLSGLYRDKWDEKHGDGTYGDLTITNALEAWTRHGSPHPGGSRGNAEAQGGETGRGPRPTTEDYIRLFEGWGYALATNDADDRLLCNGQPMTDAIEACILSKVRDYGITENRQISTAHAKETIQVMADQNRFHPVKQYLGGLTWDGLDHIAHLASHFQEKQAGTFERWFTHWIVGAVARVYEPWQTPVLVLEGGQEIGKSYFARWLCPDPALFYAGPICPDDRDNRIRRMSVWLWEIEELGSTTRREDQEALKAFITSTSIQDRRPYGHYDVTKPALASFIGTLNNDAGFLLDRTGNRRFLVAPLLGIDWAYAERVSLDGLWAQALAIYRSGDAWKLTDAERKDRDKQNAAFMIDDPAEVALEKLYEFTGKPEDFIATDTILAALHQQGFPLTRGLAMTVASVLKAWGAEADRPWSKELDKKERGYRKVAAR